MPRPHRIMVFPILSSISVSCKSLLSKIEYSVFIIIETTKTCTFANFDLLLQNAIFHTKNPPKLKNPATKCHFPQGFEKFVHKLYKIAAADVVYFLPSSEKGAYRVWQSRFFNLIRMEKAVIRWKIRNNSKAYLENICEPKKSGKQLGRIEQNVIFCYRHPLRLVTDGLECHRL